MLRHHVRHAGAGTLVAALAASKLADAVTTLVGLAAKDSVHEANPIVAAAIAAHGATAAVVAFSVGAVVATAAITEGAVALLDRYADPTPAGVHAVRLTGYGLPTVVHVVIAAQNIVVVATA
jgi:hypothetical protein